MNRRGFSVVELIIGIAVASVIAIVSASLFKAGIKTYRYTARQTVALAAGVSAMRGSGSREGMILASRSAQYVQALDAGQLAVRTSTGVVSTYMLSGGNLMRGLSTGTTVTLAADVSALAVNYYNIAATGLIVESTVAANATMATFKVTVKGLSGSRDFFSGASLRNHP